MVKMNIWLHNIDEQIMSIIDNSDMQTVFDQVMITKSYFVITYQRSVNSDITKPVMDKKLTKSYHVITY